MSVVFAENGVLMHECNDCGLLISMGDELCGPCYEDQFQSEEWEAMHPELRCPPRE